MKNSDHPTDEPSDSSIERLLADCDEALIRGEDPLPLLGRLDQFAPEVRKEFEQVFESLLSVRNTLSPKSKKDRFPRPFGKFQLLKVLGQGGFGLVFLAEDPELRRWVALKVPRLHQLVAPNAEERFLREAQMAANLEHPHLVSIYESGQAEGLPYLASAYCEGPTLARWLDERKELLSIRECAVLVEILAQAVSHMHERKIVHRDLKPSNVLMFPRERTPASPKTNGISPNFSDYVPKITDFGLAKPHDLVNDLSRTGIFLGTAAYVSPEQAWGKRESVGPSTDIYSLGVILYELLTGLAPFRGNNELDTLRQAAAAEPIPPRNLRRETPKDLETICLKCLEKQPENRYLSMSELAEDLKRFLLGRPIQAKPAGYLDRTNKLIRRQPWLTGLAGLMFVLMIVVAVGAYRFGRKDNSVTNNLSNVSDDSTSNKNATDRDPLVSKLPYEHATSIQMASQLKNSRLLKNQRPLTELKDLLAKSAPQFNQPDERTFEWYYLDKISKARFIKSNYLLDSWISYDDMPYAVSREQKAANIIDVASGKTIKKLGTFSGDLTEFHFNADGSKLLTLDFFPIQNPKGFRGEFNIFDSRNQFRLIKSKNYQHTYTDGTKIFSVAVDSDILFTIDKANRKRNRLWKLDLATCEENELPISSPVEFVVSSPRGDRLLLKEPQGVVLYDTQFKKIIKSGFGTLHTTNIAFSPDGRFFATDHKLNNEKYRVDFYDSKTLKQTNSVDLVSAVRQIAFDQDSNFVAIEFLDNIYHFYEFRTMRFLFVTKDPLFFQRFINNRSDFNEINRRDDSQPRRPKPPFLPPDAYLPPPLPVSEAWCLAFSPTSNTLAVGYDHEEGNNRESLKQWNLKTRSSEKLPGHPSTVMALAYSPDGNLLATAGYDHSVRLWNAKTGKAIIVLTGHEVPVRSVVFHPNSGILASSDNNGIVKLWDIERESLLASWRASSNQTRALVFLNDGKSLVTGGLLNSIDIWRTSDHKLLASLGDNLNVQGLALSPDGTTLASAHQDHCVQLFNLSTNKLVQTLRTHSGKVRCVAFSPDGKTLVSGGEDKMVRFFNVVSGIETMTVPTDDFINSLAFDSRGKTLAAALQNGFVRVFDGN